MHLKEQATKDQTCDCKSRQDAIVTSQGHGVAFACMPKVAQGRVRSLQQLPGGALLHHCSAIHDNSHITLHHRVQAMSNLDDGAASQRSCEQLVHDAACLRINIGSALVKDDNARLCQKNTCKAQELLLTCTRSEEEQMLSSLCSDASWF